MGGLFNPIGMGSSTEGTSPPEIMNWIHADLKIEIENGFLPMIEKRSSGMHRAVFSSTKNIHFCQS